jgi:hypothetical protein
VVKSDTGQIWPLVKFDHWSNSKLVKFQNGQIWPLVKLLSGQICPVPGLSDFHQVVKFQTGQMWSVVKFDHWSNLKMVKFQSGQIWPLVKLSGQTAQSRDLATLTFSTKWSNPTLVKFDHWSNSKLVKFQTGQICQTGQVWPLSHLRESRLPYKGVVTAL